MWSAVKRDRGIEEVGEDGDTEGVGVAEVGEGEVEGGEEEEANEEARCSRRKRCWRRVEERRRASAFRPEADRLASRAFAWLGESTGPSGYFLRPGGGNRPEKIPVLMPERYGSIVALLLLVPKAFSESKDKIERHERTAEAREGTKRGTEKRSNH